MQNHFHTDAVQITVTAFGVIILFHLIRIASAQMVGSGTPIVATVGRGMAGLVTFSNAS